MGGLILLTPLLSGACAREEPPGHAQVRPEPADCGLRGAERELAERRRAWRQARHRGPIPMNFAARACRLPTARDVALACRLENVRRLQCHFRDAQRTKAGCRFEAAATEWRRARVNLTFQFWVGGDGGVHADHFAFWTADGACRIEGAEGTGLSSRLRRWTRRGEQA